MLSHNITDNPEAYLDAFTQKHAYSQIVLIATAHRKAIPEIKAFDSKKSGDLLEELMTYDDKCEEAKLTVSTPEATLNSFIQQGEEILAKINTYLAQTASLRDKLANLASKEVFLHEYKKIINPSVEVVGDTEKLLVLYDTFFTPKKKDIIKEIDGAKDVMVMAQGDLNETLTKIRKTLAQQKKSAVATSSPTASPNASPAVSPSVSPNISPSATPRSTAAMFPSNVVNIRPAGASTPASGSVSPPASISPPSSPSACCSLM